MECGFKGQCEHLLFSSFEKSTEVQLSFVLPSITVQEHVLNLQNKHFAQYAVRTCKKNNLWV